MAAPKRKSTLKRHEMVYKYFWNLYEKKRKRYDDSLKQTADDLGYSPATIEDILREFSKV